MDRTANAGTAFKRSVGSNPTLSANDGPVDRPPARFAVAAGPPMLQLCNNRTRQDLSGRLMK